MAKYIVTKNLHMGFIRESVYVGWIIEHDAEKRSLTIDGKQFNTDKDLELMIRNKFVVPYSEENSKIFARPKPVEKTPELIHRMEIVKSDSDLKDSIPIPPKKVAAPAQKIEAPKSIEGFQKTIVEQSNLGINTTQTERSQKNKIRVTASGSTIENKTNQGPLQIIKQDQFMIEGDDVSEKDSIDIDMEQKSLPIVSKENVSAEEDKTLTEEDPIVKNMDQKQLPTLTKDQTATEGDKDLTEFVEAKTGQIVEAETKRRGRPKQSK